MKAEEVRAAALDLGALLLDTELEADPIAEDRSCPESCSLCLKVCPVSALDGQTVDQRACRPLSNYQNLRGFVLKKCWECRRICPHRQGIPDGRLKCGSH